MLLPMNRSSIWHLTITPSRTNGEMIGLAIPMQIGIGTLRRDRQGKTFSAIQEYLRMSHKVFKTQIMRSESHP